MVATDVEARADAAPAARKLSPLKGLGILGAVIVVVAGFIALCTAAGVPEFYAGFFFLLSWSALDQLKLEKLPHAAIGAAFGLFLAFLMNQLSVQMGEAGGLIFLAVILCVIYCQIMGWLTVVVNMTTMTLLTVGTIPLIQAEASFRGMALALLLGIVYFGGLAFVVKWVGDRRAKAA